MPERLLHTLSLGQVYDKDHPVIHIRIQRDTPYQNGHAAAVFTEELPLKKRADPRSRSLLDPSLIEMVEFGWSHLNPVHLSSYKVLPAVAYHLEESVVGLVYPALYIGENDPDYVRLDQ